MSKVNWNAVKIIGLAVGGVAVVATGIVVAAKILNKKKKAKELCKFNNVPDDVLDSLIPTPENKEKVAAEKMADADTVMSVDQILES